MYTRFADDFIISCYDEMAEEKLEVVKEKLIGLLADHKLDLNVKKTYIRHLKQPGDAIHLLGINLVYVEKGQNRITISDRYLRDISKDLEILQSTEIPKEEKQDMFNSIWGRVSFVIRSSASSSVKLEKMLRIKLNKPDLYLERESVMQLIS